MSAAQAISEQAAGDLALAQPALDAAKDAVGCLDMFMAEVLIPLAADALKMPLAPGWQEVEDPGEARCHDLNAQCPAWAANKECDSNAKFMMVHCAESCDPGCGGPSTPQLDMAVVESRHERPIVPFNLVIPLGVQ